MESNAFMPRSPGGCSGDRCRLRSFLRRHRFQSLRSAHAAFLPEAAITTGELQGRHTGELQRRSLTRHALMYVQAAADLAVGADALGHLEMMPVQLICKNPTQFHYHLGDLQCV